VIGPRARAIWWALAFGAMVTQFVLSSIPGDQLVAPSFDFADKLGHALAYAAIAGALGLALSNHPPRRAFAIAAGVAIVYGISDEIHQIFTPRRSASWDDVVADAVGAVIGAAVAAAIATRYRRRRAGPESQQARTESEPVQSNHASTGS
jgi:VanZ family protein